MYPQFIVPGWTPAHKTHIHENEPTGAFKSRLHKLTSSYLVLPVARQEMLRHMCRQDVLQQNPVEVLHRFDLLALLLKLVLPQEV